MASIHTIGANCSDAPELLESRELYHGEQIALSIDRVKEQGLVYNREIVRHPGSAAVIPLFADATVALVRQYRHPTRKYLLEIPAGSLEAEESPEATAARELREEVGLIASRLDKLCEFFVSPGFLQEKMWVYLATELSNCKQELEADEFIEVLRIPFDKALKMITSGQIEDAKTIIGLILAAPRVGLALPDGAYPAV